MDHRYTYDVNLSMLIQVSAPTEAIAECRLWKILDAIGAGKTEYGAAETVTVESLLIEIDGEEEIE